MIVKALNLLFGILFPIIGVLNALLIHPVPGVFYLLLAFLYLPQTDVVVKKKLSITIPPVLKAIIGLVVMWGTLAVGDLAELMGL